MMVCIVYSIAKHCIATFTKLHFLLLADKSGAATKFSNIPLFELGTSSCLANNREYLHDKLDEIELLLDLLYSHSIVQDCAWNPLEQLQEEEGDSEKKKRRAKNEKKSAVTMNNLNKMFILPDADRFIAIDLLVHGNVVPGSSFEKLCSYHTEIS